MTISAEPPRPRPARAQGGRPCRSIRFRGAVALVLILALAGCGGGTPDAAPAGNVRVSLLALGDTGRPLNHFWSPDWQVHVAEAMAIEDGRRPVDALVFLGDNFYERGLTRGDMVRRLQQNLVGPYCRFVELAGPASAEVAGACRTPPGRRRAVPIFAVLGNHDHYAPESAKLERTAVPRYVSNWRMPSGVAEAYELGGGVSLILFDSEVLAYGKRVKELTDALRKSKGPWRILVAHRPLVDDPHDEEPGYGAHRYIAAVKRAITDAGVSVQLMLSGHKHNLQVLELPAPLPRLGLIAGAGSRAQPLGFQDPDRRFGRVSLGFARVDLAGEGASQRLVGSIYAVSRFPFLTGAEPRLVARWSVDREGRVRDEGIASGAR